MRKTLSAIGFLCSLAVSLPGHRLGAEAPKIGQESKPVQQATTVAVVTRCPGMSAESMDSGITARLERALQQAEGVQGSASTSRLGVSIVHVHFQEEITAAVALA